MPAKNVGRKIDSKSCSSEVSDRYEEKAIGQWKIGDSCYKVAVNLAELSYSVLWKVGLVSDEIGYLVEQISKQSVEGGAWFLLTA